MAPELALIPKLKYDHLLSKVKKQIISENNPEKVEQNGGQISSNKKLFAKQTVTKFTTSKLGAKRKVVKEKTNAKRKLKWTSFND
ncbi:hypothetical protein ACF0H5_016792 [Mactra antiquata]